MTDAMDAALAALTMAFAPSATGAFHLSSTHLPLVALSSRSTASHTRRPHREPPVHLKRTLYLLRPYACGVCVRVHVA